ncbi:MAG: Mu transposase domain-containing protein [bacterium]
MQLNRNRQQRFQEEQRLLRPLPGKALPSCSKFTVVVGPSSTIRIKKNVYSVHSRLIGEKVVIRLYADYLQTLTNHWPLSCGTLAAFPWNM